MDSLVTRVAVAVAGFRDDATPYVPSRPVDIGTAGAHHSRSEIGYWQMLIVMFIAAIIIGALVLLFVVRQRGRLLKRRRLRRMAEVAQLVGGGVGEVTGAASPPSAAPMPSRGAGSAPGRAAPNA